MTAVPSESEISRQVPSGRTSLSTIMVATTRDPAVNCACRLIGSVIRKTTTAVATAQRIAKPILVMRLPELRHECDQRDMPPYPCDFCVAGPPSDRFGYDSVSGRARAAHRGGPGTMA